MPKQKVLVPLDGSEFSRQIFGHIMRFISPAANELILVHVAPAPVGTIARPTRPASAEVPLPMEVSEQDVERRAHPIFESQERERLIARLSNELQVDMLRLQDAGYEVSTTIQFGHPAEEIARFAEQQAVQLVAMTTHGRTGIRRLLFGSVAEYLLRHLTVPVLLLRPSDTPYESDKSRVPDGGG